MGGRARAYIDTSVVSALFDDRNPERRKLTDAFFNKGLELDLFLSEVTIAELNSTPDPSKRQRMKDMVAGYPVLTVTEEIKGLANDYVAYRAMPRIFLEDAYHVAIAVLNDMDFLLSWNFKHIVRRKTKDVVRMVNSLHGLGQVEILTPAELL